jgi:CheY-like chemotaxis protein
MKVWQVLAAAPPRISQDVPNALEGHIAQEDLEQFALDKTAPGDRLVEIESHLHHCNMCQRNFDDARAFSDRLRDLLRAEGRRDQRKSVRYHVRESAIITVCRPTEVFPVIGQVMDVSSAGLRIRLLRTMHRSTQVQVQVQNAIVFGTIRYCREVAVGQWDIGIAIDQVVMRPQQHWPETEVRERDASTGKLRKSPAVAALDAVEVLLVEDNPADAKLMEFIFEDFKFDCRLTIAIDGAQAVERLFDPRVPKPNLVLLDLNLPRLSGLEVLRKLRQERSTETVPVAVLSSSIAQTDLQLTTALGIRAYLPKPENIQDYADLRTRLEDLVSDAVH